MNRKTEAGLWTFLKFILATLEHVINFALQSSWMSPYGHISHKCKITRTQLSCLKTFSWLHYHLDALLSLPKSPHHILKQFPTTCKKASFLCESYLEVQEGNEKVFNLTHFSDQIYNNFLKGVLVESICFQYS